MIALSASPRYAAGVADRFWQGSQQTHSSMTDEEFAFYYRQIRTVVEPRPDQKIADYGCGEGSIALLFKRDGFDIVGTDISWQLVARCRERGLDCQQVDEFFASRERYALIIANNAFFYVHPRRRAELLTRLRNKLEPDGRLCILDEPDLRKRHLLSANALKRALWAVLPVYSPDTAGFFDDVEATGRRGLRCRFRSYEVRDSWAPYRSHLILTA
jgi:SAM-dependent methyltransferase